jgi:hypothetical protein
MTVNSQLTQTAARILDISVSEAESNCKEIPDHSVVQFWNPARGGAAIIIGQDMTYLRYSGMTGPIQALERYLAGERTRSAVDDRN